MSFWNMNSMEPKRTFRYKIVFGGNNSIMKGTEYFAQSVTKPSYKVSSVPYQYLNHKFNYPGRVEWEDITIDFIDAGSPTDASIPDMSRSLMKLIESAGYKVPTSGGDLTSISKKGIIGGVGDSMDIKQLNAAGEVVEQWVVYNPMFLDVKFGDLSYDKDEISKATVTVKYDYAKLVDLQDKDKNLIPK